MTAIGFLSTAPVTEGRMSGDVATAIEALEAYDVRYEMGPMGTTIEAEDVAELFAAAQAAHEAIDGDRVSTFLKIDDKRSSDGTAAEKVAAVESHLGRAASSEGDTDA